MMTELLKTDHYRIFQRDNRVFSAVPHKYEGAADKLRFPSLYSISNSHQRVTAMVNIVEATEEQKTLKEWNALLREAGLIE